MYKFSRVGGSLELLVCVLHLFSNIFISPEKDRDRATLYGTTANHHVPTPIASARLGLGAGPKAHLLPGRPRGEDRRVSVQRLPAHR